ncbi:hypothetical protein [Sphingosinicella sp. BN140058]|uniref:hypothetical protein n=1 Tax=Sphingosinicella sp. BN140058 TaxID=1892855 RepID=UPI001011A05A|nr:hypothetical protein [Sphingosinicella sp. BN140058]QAY77442.1 hypothetical protein ETR14_13695 [Sphingosinicella sp. BN140058]
MKPFPGRFMVSGSLTNFVHPCCLEQSGISKDHSCNAARIIAGFALAGPRRARRSGEIEAVRPVRKPIAAQGASSARKALASDYDAISTVCRAGSKSRDPAAFFGALTDAFAMSKTEAAALRSHCTLYLMGSRDGAQRRF